jgi:hypothetical protein
VNLEDPLPLSQGNWAGGFPDPYPGGEICAKFNPGVSTGMWFCYPRAEGDLHFRTYLTPLGPTAKDQCKNGGWRNYPVFKNQGQCITFVQRQALAGNGQFPTITGKPGLNPPAPATR